MDERALVGAIQPPSVGTVGPQARLEAHDVVDMDLVHCAGLIVLISVY
jgi:hypothetical protein